MEFDNDTQKGLGGQLSRAIEWWILLFDTALLNCPKTAGVRDLGHAHFQGNYLCGLLGIPNTKPPTKFEVSSSISFRMVNFTIQPNTK